MAQNDRKIFSETQTRACQGCGARPRRGDAKFCLICGKLLREDYQPLDRLRSSYKLQGTDFRYVEEEEIVNLFEENQNNVSHTAWASLVYSMVPYLGIVFVPFTVLIGSMGYFAAVRRPQIGGRRLSAKSVAASFVVLGVQVFLWWLLYKIPEIGVSGLFNL